MDFPFSLLADTFVFDESTGITARKQYEDHLNKNCRAYLPPGKRFLVEVGMDETLVERVVNIPFPRISVQRLSQIKDYIEEDLASQNPYWEMAISRLNELEEDCERRATHRAIWRIIKSTHEDMMDDYEWIIQACTTLEADPSQMGGQLDDHLAPRIGRFLGTCTWGDEEGYDLPTGMAELEKLKEDHYDYYVLIRAICELTDDDDYMSTHAKCVKTGEKAAQYLRTLVDMLSSYNPEHDLKAEIFQSLKRRAVRVSNGSRKRSPSPLEGLDSGSEDYEDCDSVWE
ncbi:hypothetical protein ACHAPJ_005756 [Fusarium lateritium]